jgi:hypothetical protein
MTNLSSARHARAGGHPGGWSAAVGADGLDSPVKPENDGSWDGFIVVVVVVVIGF